MTDWSPRPDVDDRVREVTDTELRHYWDNGWVKLERFVTADLAAELLDAAKEQILGDGPANRIPVPGWFENVYNAGRDEKVDPFASLLRAPTIGRNAKRLMRRKGVAVHSDIISAKMGQGHPSSEPTSFHQDAFFPLDRTGQLIFWLAIDDMTPDMGTMRFLTGSHREGPLGPYSGMNGNDRELLDYHPYLEEEYSWSPPMTLEAGDCVVLNVVTIHGAPANETDRPRWAYVINCHPSDARWTGAPVGGAFVKDTDVQEAGDLIRSEKFYYFADA